MILRNRYIYIIFLIGALCNWAGAIKCGFGAARGSKGRPGRPFKQHSYSTEHFKIWYDLMGDAAVDSTDVAPANGVPDWVDTTAKICEYCWVFEVDSLNYNEPLPDSSSFRGISGVGGDDRVDLYITNCGARGRYGATYPDTGLGDKKSAFLEIDNNYTDPDFSMYSGCEEEALQVTIAHEFFHVIQCGYNYMEDDDMWWMEATAVWMEEAVFDDVNDYYYYLGNFFNFPDKELTLFDFTHEYGAVVFPLFLTEKFDRDIIRRSWVLCGDGYPLISFYTNSVLDSVLRVEGASFTEAFTEFSLWNIFTGSFADTTRFYSEGYNYPELNKEPLDFVNFISLSVKSMEELSNIYFLVEPENVNEVVESLAVIRDGDLEWCGGGFAVGDTTFFSGSLPFSLVDAEISTELPLIFFVSSIEGNTSFFDSVVIFLYKGWDELENYYPYPNPFIVREGDELTVPYFLDRERDMAMVIYSTSGDVVYQESIKLAEPGPHNTPGTAFTWGGKNQYGEDVASGIYIIKLFDDGDEFDKFKVFVNNQLD